MSELSLKDFDILSAQEQQEAVGPILFRAGTIKLSATSSTKSHKAS